MKTGGFVLDNVTYRRSSKNNAVSSQFQEIGDLVRYDEIYLNHGCDKLLWMEFCLNVGPWVKHSG